VSDEGGVVVVVVVVVKMGLRANSQREYLVEYNRLGIISFLSIFIVSCICPCTWFDLRNYTSDTNNPNPQIELLKSYVSGEALSKANPDYYAFFGFRDWWRFPLVYPYSIHTIDEVNYGCLYDERNITDYDDINNQVIIDMGICEITHLTLDKDYLLLQVEEGDRFGASQAVGPEFIIFNFNTAEKTTFNSKDELLAEAKKLGFGGKLELMTLREYDNLFWK